MRCFLFGFNGASRLMMTVVNSADFQLEKFKAQYMLTAQYIISILIIIREGRGLW